MTDKDDAATASYSMSVERKKEILKERAQLLARPLKGEKAREETIDVVEFRLARESYAVEQACVREVYPLKELTPLPCTPAFMLGMINVRGQILPVIDIKRFFDLPETGITDLHLVIVVQADNIEVGILADAIVGVRSISSNKCQSALPTLTGIRASYLKAVTDDSLVILDVRKILADPKIIVNEEAQA